MKQIIFIFLNDWNQILLNFAWKKLCFSSWRGGRFIENAFEKHWGLKGMGVLFKSSIRRDPSQFSGEWFKLQFELNLGN